MPDASDPRRASAPGRGRRRGAPPIVRSSLRYRGGASSMLMLLTLVAVAAAAAGPLYQRSVETAAVRSVLARAGVAQSGLSISAPSEREARDAVPRGAARRLFGAAVSGTEADVTPAAGRGTVVAPLVARDGSCAHLIIVSGRCPRAAGEIMVSRASATRLGAQLDASLPLAPTGARTKVTLPESVVGLYRVRNADDPYWAGRKYFSATDSGVVSREIDIAGKRPDIFHVEAVFVDQAGLSAVRQAYDRAGILTSSPLRSALDLALRIDRVGPDDLRVLRGAAQYVQQRLVQQHPDPGDEDRGTVLTSLPQLTQQAQVGRGQTRLIIPALAAELALVVLVVVSLVLAAAVDARRGEMALARLRGASRSRTARLFTAEVGAVAAIAAVPGFALGWLAAWTAARIFLPGTVPVIPDTYAIATALAVLGLELVLAVALARRAAGRPVNELLRHVAPRRRRRAVGAGEAAIAIAAGGAVVVVLGGDRATSLAIVAPGLVALFAGLVLARIVPLVGGARGRPAWWSGRFGQGLAGLRVARTGDSRRVVVLVCLAVALVVGAVDLWSTAAGERHARAAVEAGAAVRLDLDAPAVDPVRRAVGTVDRTGDFAAISVVQQPGGGATEVLAVDTPRWADVTQWGHARDRPSAATLQRLMPSTKVPAITATGSQLAVQFGAVQLGGSGVRAPTLRFAFRLSDGTQTTTSVTVGASGTDTSAVLGCQDGCRLLRIDLVRASGDFVEAKVAVALASVRIGDKSVDLGSSSAWGDVSTTQPKGSADAASLDTSGDQPTLRVDSHGGTAGVQHLDVPLAIPCLAAGSEASAARRGEILSVRGLDGQPIACRGVGGLPLVPYLGREAVLVDLDDARTAAGKLSGSTVSVWLARPDPARERALTQALGRSGIDVAERVTLAGQQRRYDDSPPAWALQVALLTGGGAALVAAVLILVVALASRRERRHDLAALRLVGVPARTLRRAVRLEQYGVILTAVVTGSVLGVLGARLTLPSVPLFVSPAAVPRPAFVVPWFAVTLAAVTVLVLLVAAGTVAVRLVGAGSDRAHPAGQR